MYRDAHRDYNRNIYKSDNSYQMLLMAEELLKNNRTKGFNAKDLEKSIELIKKVISLEKS